MILSRSGAFLPPAYWRYVPYGRKNVFVNKSFFPSANKDTYSFEFRACVCVCVRRFVLKSWRIENGEGIGRRTFARGVRVPLALNIILGNGLGIEITRLAGTSIALIR